MNYNNKSMNGLQNIYASTIENSNGLYFRGLTSNIEDRFISISGYLLTQGIYNNYFNNNLVTISSIIFNNIVSQNLINVSLSS